MSEHNDEFAAIRKALAEIDHDEQVVLFVDRAYIASLLAAADRAKELEADARRYRWLRERQWNLSGAALRFYTFETLRLESADADPLDGAIDRAQGTAT